MASVAAGVGSMAVQGSVNDDEGSHREEKRRDSGLADSADSLESEASNKNSPSKRFIIWWATLGTAVLTAVLVSLGTGLASKIVSHISSPSNPVLRVTVEPDPTFLSPNAWLLPPRQFSVSRLKSDYEGIGNWAPRLGARPAGVMALKVSITAAQQGGATITGIEAQVVRRSPLAPYILVYNPGQGGVVSPSTALGLNLDEIVPYASTIPKGQAPSTARSLGQAFFGRYSIDLADGSTHIFELAAYAKALAIYWDLRIDYIAQGEAGHLIVTNTGHPFSLIGYAGHTKFVAIYIPGYIAYPPDYRDQWKNVGTRLCPVYYRPC